MAVVDFTRADFIGTMTIIIMVFIIATISFFAHLYAIEGGRSTTYMYKSLVYWTTVSMLVLSVTCILYLIYGFVSFEFADAII